MMSLNGIQFLTLWLAVCISGGYARAPKKIVHGTNAQPGQFPHQVSLQGRNSHFCGGSIIDATHILTAAHCVVSDELVVTQPHEIQVITGVTNNTARVDSNTFRVSRVIPHQNYIRKPVTNDIAILKLARPIIFNDFQKPIHLPSHNTLGITQVSASGWGALDNSRTFSSELKQLAMVTLDPARCDYYFGHGVGPGHICAAHATGTGVCFGDSGGPLTHQNEIVGIASFVAGECATEFPDVYTRVYHYLPWIRHIILHTP